jgi:hypothetical protein
MTQTLRLFGLAFALGAALAVCLAAAPLHPREQVTDSNATLKRLIPIAPDGQGGSLFIQAPTGFCADSSGELEIRHYTDTAGGGNAMRSAVRGPAGPSACQWQFSDMPRADYDAVIRRTGRIVAAAGKTRLERGASAVLQLQASATEVTGRITVNGSPPTDAQLIFTSADSAFNVWSTSVDSRGDYRLTVDSGPSGLFLVVLASNRAQAIGGISLGSVMLAPGVRTFDQDITVPPGVLRVEVAPWPRGSDSDATSLTVQVRSSNKEVGSGSYSVTKGFRGEYIGASYGRHEVSIETVPAHKVVARAVITLTPEQPAQSVHLTIPAAALTCEDGWVADCRKTK